jgi:hypothetical protein
MSKQFEEPTGRRWWAYGHVWLVIAGPLLVVVASFVTYYLAARGQDPVLSTGAQVTAPVEGPGNALAPAVQARNHAATGELPAPKPSTKP